MTNKLVSQQLAPHINPTDNVVLFDGVCVLCNAWVDFLLRYDTQGQFKLASVQSSVGQAILRHYDQPLVAFTTMYVVEGKVLYMHSTAFIRVVSKLGLPWSLAAIGWLIPRFIRDAVYRVIARYRYRLFGKRDACRMPDTLQDMRFLQPKKRS